MSPPSAATVAAPHLGRTDGRFRPLVRRDGVEGRYEISEHKDRGYLLAELEPNTETATTTIAGMNFLRDLHRIRDPTEGPYTLLFHPNRALRPVPEVRRLWADEMRSGRIERLALLNYDTLGTALKVVAQLLVVASGNSRRARFFHTLDDALDWLDEDDETRAEPVDPFEAAAR